jgi:hypothetical protein
MPRRARNRVPPAIAALFAAALCGCVEVTPPAPPPPTTIELVNATADDVRPQLYVSDRARNVFELVVAANLNTAWTDRPFPELRPFEIRTLTLECDQLAAVGISQPTRFDSATLTVTPTDDQIFLARGNGFACGDTIRFVFFNDGATFRARVEFR